MKKIYSMLALAFLIALSGCSKENPTPPDSYMGNKIESGLPWMIPDTGGAYEIILKEDFMRWVGVEKWDYRMFIGGEEVGTGTVAGRALKIEIPATKSSKSNAVIVEGYLPNISKTGSEWQNLAYSEISSPFVEIDGTWWAPGNLTLKEGKFTFAANPEELGLYFKHNSCYGVLSEGTAYSGKCYTPEEKTVALADIPEKDGDPCLAVSGGSMRLPSLYEMQKLYYAYDFETVAINDINCFSFGGGEFILSTGWRI